MRIIDISQPLTRGMAVWPGDQPYESRWSARISAGSSVNVGAVTMSLHTGTHADAALHVADGDTPIDQMPLEAYVGPAVVVEAYAVDALTPKLLVGIDLQRYPRVLFRTRQSQSGIWEEPFAFISAELARNLVAAGVRLVGLDTPSVDAVDSKTLDAHHILFGGRVANLENLLLEHVAPGYYELIALPLRIEGMDGSPVRAVLVER
jgi:arylformamidase